MTIDAQWHEDRKTGIGGSDAPAVMGLSRFGRGPMSVWLDKVGMTDPKEPTLRQWIGLRLETMIREMAEVRLGLKFRRRYGLIRSSEYPWMIGNVDFVGLEVKTSYGAEGWADDGQMIASDSDLDVIPIDYLLQVQHYLIVTGWKRLFVAVLIGHDDFRTYEVHPMPGLAARIIEAEREFWHVFVVPGVPPPVDDTEASKAWLRQKYPRVMGELRAATPEETLLLDQLGLAGLNAKQAGSQYETLQARLKAAIGDDLGIRAAGVTATWPIVERKAELNWEAIARAYRAIIEGAPMADLDAIVSLHTSTPETYRRLNVSRR